MLLVIRFLRRAEVGQQGHGRISKSPLTDPLLSTINKFADCELSVERDNPCFEEHLFVASVETDHAVETLHVCRLPMIKSDS